MWPRTPWQAGGVTKLLRLRCVTALVSLFEGRSDYTVHARVISQLDVGVLKRVLCDVYTAYRDK